MYENGSVHFNDGSILIVALNVTSWKKESSFFLDSEIRSNPHYFDNQKQYAKCLLNASSELVDFNLKHMFIVTWKDYSLGNESQVT